MNIQDFRESVAEIPDFIQSQMEMLTPNDRLQIHSGTYVLESEFDRIEVVGDIYFDWFPEKGVRFTGEVTQDSITILQAVESKVKFNIKVDESIFGEAFITNFGTNKYAKFNGLIINEAILGDSTIAVSRIDFVIPNLRDFLGDSTKLDLGTEIKMFRSRLHFSYGKFIIRIDKCSHFADNCKALKDQGGYVTLYSGQITSSGKGINRSEIKDLLSSFSCFLTFLNGRRTAPYFLQGIYGDEVKWTDYTAYRLDEYKYVTTWPGKNSITGLNDLWHKFGELWKDPNDRDFIRTVVHWYVESNTNTGYLDGSIVLSQIALELLYNWLVIERKKLLIGNDAQKITAGNKIRLLLSQVDQSGEIPLQMNEMKRFVDDNSDLNDSVDAFVQIRNAIVHSQKDKRFKLSRISSELKYEIREISLWYIEITILRVLEFRGDYYNRCTKRVWAGEGEEKL